MLLLLLLLLQLPKKAKPSVLNNNKCDNVAPQVIRCFE